MNLLFLGDCVGKPGLQAIAEHLPRLRGELNLQAVVVNAENAADGSGLTKRQFGKLMDAGVDCLTMGDHIYRRDEIKDILRQDRRIVKPANYPATAAGHDWTSFTAANGVEVAVISLLGRVYMRPVDCPFAAADRVLAEMPAEIRVILCDIHAEATSDKQLIGRYLDGRVSAVLGTHTHVPTADACILPGGTAFQTDVGMSGPYHSVIGRNFDRVLQTTISFEPTHFYVATEDVRLCGALITVDPASGSATAIERFEYRCDNT
ncbi:TIGR00282 family metallophosphoesterase [Planctomycetaceae bacterium SH139]